VNGPAVTGLETAGYVIPTDAPEADGTLARDKTTMVLVTARVGGEQGLGWRARDRKIPRRCVWVNSCPPLV